MDNHSLQARPVGAPVGAPGGDSGHGADARDRHPAAASVGSVTRSFSKPKREGPPSTLAGASQGTQRTSRPSHARKADHAWGRWCW